jgi:hypothetical protein
MTRTRRPASVVSVAHGMPGSIHSESTSLHATSWSRKPLRIRMRASSYVTLVRPMPYRMPRVAARNSSSVRISTSLKESRTS